MTLMVGNKHLEQVSRQRQEASYRLPGAGGEGIRGQLSGSRVYFGVDRSV